MHLSPSSRLLVLLAILAAAPLHAALEWETTHIQQEAPLGKESMDMVFPFTNRGNSPVTITTVHTSCGCTAPTLEKKDYAPGERGELKIVYSTAGQSGIQERTVTVYTSDKPDQPAMLTLEVVVPEIFRITPRLVSWRVDEPADEKPMVIDIHAGLVNPRISIVDAGSDRFTTELRKSAMGTGHTLVLKPVATATAVRSTLRLKIEAENVSAEVVTVYAMVR